MGGFEFNLCNAGIPKYDKPKGNPGGDWQPGMWFV